jgi:hypothetical protein
MIDAFWITTAIEKFRCLGVVVQNNFRKERLSTKDE